jgi:hypothetical protein
MKEKSLADLAKELDYTTADDVCQYIIDSHKNGQFTQAKELFLSLQKLEMSYFLFYLFENVGSQKATFKYFREI